MTVTDISTAPRLRFAMGARTIAQALRGSGLVVPAFRTPPRQPGVSRAVRRSDRGVVVAVAVEGRPFPAVLADLIEGVVVINGLEAEAAAGLRDSLWRAVEGLDVAPGSSRRAAARGVPPAADQADPQSSATRPADLAAAAA